MAEPGQVAPAHALTAARALRTQDLGQFNVVLLANLICRLPQPMGERAFSCGLPCGCSFSSSSHSAPCFPSTRLPPPLPNQTASTP